VSNPWAFRKRHTAWCAVCGERGVWDDQACRRCGTEDGPEARMRLSTGEERALEYVMRGMPDGLWDPNYWPGVTNGDVALARSLWKRWQAWVSLVDTPPTPPDENPLFSPRFK